MSNFNSISLLKINQQVVSLGQALTYLQLFGRLNPFIKEILRYHAIIKGLEEEKDLEVTIAEVGQAIIDFRMRSELTDPDRFKQWLASQGVDYSALEQQVLVTLKLERLKSKLADSALENYFEERRHELEQVDLYYLLISDEAMAYQLKERIDGGESFERIARQYPLSEAEAETDSSAVIVKRDILRRQQVRGEIKKAIADAPLQTLVGPIAMGTRWCLCQVEQVLPAVLETTLKQELTEQLFEQWLTTKLESLTVEAVEPISQETTEFTAGNSLADTATMLDRSQGKAEQMTKQPHPVGVPSDYE